MYTCNTNNAYYVAVARPAPILSKYRVLHDTSREHCELLDCICNVTGYQVTLYSITTNTSHTTF